MPDDPLIWPLLLQLVLISLNAIFACAEIAIISINDNKLKLMADKGDKRAIRLVNLTQYPAKFLATIQVGITLAGFLGSAFAADNFSGMLVNWFVSIGVTLSVVKLKLISVLLITIILSFLTLVLGELVPKRVAMQKPEQIGLALSGLVTVIAKVFSPLVWLLSVSTNGILRLVGIDPHTHDNDITEEEIRMMVDAGSEKGAIDDDEKQLIHNVFEFDNKTAGEIMTHRTDVALLWLEEGDDVWEKTVIEKRYTMYPICDQSADDIIGILNTKDYFRLKDRTRENVMANAVRPVQFVPETVRTDILFKNMKKSRNHFAVVLDEYGGMGGIITINDLLEEIVGDLENDTAAPVETPMIELISDNLWSIKGSTPIEAVGTALNIKLPVEEYDTFAGLVFGLLGTIPDDGETPELNGYGLYIKVTEIREHRMEGALVSVIVK